MEVHGRQVSRLCQNLGLDTVPLTVGKETLIIAGVVEISSALICRFVGAWTRCM